MNECKSTADIVELMSRIVIVVDCSNEGQKKKRPAATDRKEKKRSKQRKYQEKYDRI